MSQRTSVTTDASGRRVMAKVAGNADEAARLSTEAASLDQGRHPGVAELVGVDGHGVGAVLLTAHVDGPVLSSVGLLPLEEGAGVLAAVAATLADLHDLGLVHGAVCGDHVILGPGGRPVLCGMGYGGRIGDPPGPPPALGAAFTDPARSAAAVLDPTIDVFGLGALARVLAPEPPPGHALGRIAAEATAPDPSDRPKARAIADAVQAEVPAARLPRGLAPAPAPARVSRPVDPLDAWRHERSQGGGRRRTAPRRPLVVGAVVVFAGLVAAGLVLTPHPGGSAPTLAMPAAAPAPDGLRVDEARPDPTTTRVGPASSTTVPRPTTVPPRRDCPPVTGLLQADVDGDGCPDALRFADGILEAAGHRWSLGRAGDQVATGDWGCQGTFTLALFRPSTGEVFRFDGWAGAGHDLVATAIAVVPGGQALRAADVDRDGCHEVVVERATGAAAVIRVGSATMRRRVDLRPVAWATAMVGATAALQLSARGALAPPPLAQPGRWAGWLRDRDPVTAAFSLVRLVGLGALWYLAVVTVVGLLLRLAGAARLATAADKLTVAPVRRLLAGVSLGLAATTVAGAVGPTALLPAAVAAQPAPSTTTTSTRSTSTTATTLLGPGPPATVTMHLLSPAEPAPSPAVAPPALAPAAPADPEAGGLTTGRWTVRPGECLWTIAESVLSTAWGRPPSDAEIVPYWQRLIAANHAVLVHADNPDLIFPAQVFDIPPP